MVFAVDHDGTAARHVEPLKELGQRALAAAARPHQRGAFTGWDSEIQALKQERQILAIAELDVAKFNLAARTRQRLRNDRIRLDRGIHDVCQAPHRNLRLLEILPETDDAQHRLRDPAGEHLKGDQHANGEIAVMHD